MIQNKDLEISRKYRKWKHCVSQFMAYNYISAQENDTAFGMRITKRWYDCKQSHNRLHWDPFTNCKKAKKKGRLQK